MKKYKFGVLGAGNMGTAIAEGAVRAGRFAPEQVLMFNRSEEKPRRSCSQGLRRHGRLYRGLRRKRDRAAGCQAAEFRRNPAESGEI